eukprot:3521875-Rhodomonas_salina.2
MASHFSGQLNSHMFSTVGDSLQKLGPKFQNELVPATLLHNGRALFELEGKKHTVELFPTSTHPEFRKDRNHLAWFGRMGLRSSILACYPGDLESVQGYHGRSDSMMVSGNC